MRRHPVEQFGVADLASVVGGLRGGGRGLCSADGRGVERVAPGGVQELIATGEVAVDGGAREPGGGGDLPDAGSRMILQQCHRGFDDPAEVLLGV